MQTPDSRRNTNMTNPKQNKELLGKGIRSLLQSIDSDLKTNSGQLKQNVVENATGISRIPVEDVEANPKQPRKDFDETSLKELADSIRLHESFSRSLYRN